MSSGKSSRSDGPGASDAVITPAGDAGAVAGSSLARMRPADPADKNMEASTMTPTRHAEADADQSDSVSVRLEALRAAIDRAVDVDEHDPERPVMPQEMRAWAQELRGLAAEVETLHGLLAEANAFVPYAEADALKIRLREALPLVSSTSDEQSAKEADDGNH